MSRKYEILAKLKNLNLKRQVTYFFDIFPGFFVKFINSTTNGSEILLRNSTVLKDTVQYLPMIYLWGEVWLLNRKLGII